MYFDEDDEEEDVPFFGCLFVFIVFFCILGILKFLEIIGLKQEGFFFNKNFIAWLF